MKLKIAINGFFLTRPFTGIATYTTNLLKSLAEIDKENQYFIIVPEKVDLKLPNNFKFIILPFPEIPTLSLKKSYWEQVKLPNKCEELEANMAFFPYPSNPYNPKKIRKFKIPTIVTVHDTIPWDNESYRKKLRSKLYQVFARNNLKYADKIIAVSKSTREDLYKYNIPKEKIEVVYNTLSPETEIKKTISGRRAIIKKFKLDKNPYFLYVGGYDERKNVNKLIRAFKKANQKKNFKLVLAGKAHFNDALYSSFNQKKDKNLIWTDAISDRDLYHLYKSAHAFIHFSLAEGFNLPLLEAAYFKLPIGTSNLKVHKEVLKDGAIYADPKNNNELIKVIKQLMTLSEKDKKKLLMKSEESIKKFDYKKEGEKMLKTIKSLYREQML